MSSFNRLRSSLVTLLSGTATAQLVLFLSAPVLTRLYEPSAFGQYAMIGLIVSLAIVVATGKYELAVLLPKENSDAWALVCLGALLSLVVSAVSLVALLLMVMGYPVLTARFGMDMPSHELLRACMYSAGMMLLGAWQIVLFAWMNRQGQFREISTSRVAQALIMCALQIVLASRLGGIEGLLLGTLCGLAAAVALQLYFVFRRPACGFVGAGRLLELARVHANLPKHSIPTDFIGTLLAQFPVYFLGANFTQSTVGYYSLAQRTLQAPMQLISNSVGEIFRRDAAAKYNEHGQCASYFVKVSVALLLLASPAVIVFSIWGGDIFALIFGEPWRTAGDYSGILIFMFALKFVVSPVSFMFFIVRKTGIDLGLHAFFLAVMALSFYMLPQHVSSVGSALVLFVSIYSMMYAAYYFLSYRYAKGLG